MEVQGLRNASLVLGLVLAGTMAVSGPALAQEESEYRDKAIPLVQSYVESGFFSGAVLVAKDGQPLLRESFGLANREWNIPNAPDTKFRLASITKSFTATVILQLEEAGRLSVDDPIANYYESAPAAWEDITVKHLLNHTSGIPSYTAIPGFFENMSGTDLTPREIIELTQDEPLHFAPGAEYEYNNTGYVLLGYTIEKISGQSYGDYVQDHVFDPLEMRNSGYDDNDTIVPQRAYGYARRPNGELENAAYVAMSLPHAGGSLYSTVDDLLIWDQALYAERLIGSVSSSAMFTDYGHNYGFGSDVSEAFGHRLLGHNGFMPGFQTAFTRYPDDNLTVVLLANIELSPSFQIGLELAGLYFGADQTATEVAVDPTLFDDYAGRYEVHSDFIITISREDNRLILDTAGPKVELVAKSDAEYYVPLRDAQYEFQRDANGLVSGVIRNGALAPRLE